MTLPRQRRHSWMQVLNLHFAQTRLILNKVITYNYLSSNVATALITVFACKILILNEIHPEFAGFDAELPAKRN